MASEELPLVYEQSAWNAEGLGPFLRLCLMDQNFPAFVEEVEKELKKLTEGWVVNSLVYIQKLGAMGKKASS